ncbi:unnamed protein product [Trichogramma brassicae]|uniref:Enoyl-CoA delta isomerase 2, mitochondrial n=1 Tax=Trichogramma brassicae TaxID=86971 RepID=A0A6H5J5Y4_9HYME|nr:unnamed protein product [Trichogramma brassicae]
MAKERRAPNSTRTQSGAHDDDDVRHASLSRSSQHGDDGHGSDVGQRAAEARSLLHQDNPRHAQVRSNILWLLRDVCLRIRHLDEVQSPEEWRVSSRTATLVQTSFHRWQSRWILKSFDIMSMTFHFLKILAQPGRCLPIHFLRLFYQSNRFEQNPEFSGKQMFKENLKNFNPGNANRAPEKSAVRKMFARTRSTTILCLTTLVLLHLIAQARCRSTGGDYNSETHHRLHHHQQQHNHHHRYHHHHHHKHHYNNHHRQDEQLLEDEPKSSSFEENDDIDEASLVPLSRVRREPPRLPELDGNDQSQSNSEEEDDYGGRASRYRDRSGRHRRPTESPSKPRNSTDDPFLYDISAAHGKTVCPYEIVPVPEEPGREPRNLLHLTCLKRGSTCRGVPDKKSNGGGKDNDEGGGGGGGAFCCIQLYRDIELRWDGGRRPNTWLRLDSGCACTEKKYMPLRRFESGADVDLDDGIVHIKVQRNGRSYYEDYAIVYACATHPSGRARYRFVCCIAAAAAAAAAESRALINDKIFIVYIIIRAAAYRVGLAAAVADSRECRADTSRASSSSSSHNTVYTAPPVRCPTTSIDCGRSRIYWRRTTGTLRYCSIGKFAPCFKSERVSSTSRRKHRVLHGTISVPITSFDICSLFDEHVDDLIDCSSSSRLTQGRKMSQYIGTSIEGSIQRIVIDRPRKRNAINGPMYREMIKILDESAKNREVTCLAITGTGDFYSSGNDFVSNLTAADESAADVDGATLIIQNFVDALINYPKLLIAVVNGPAIGIMATTLALFDIVYAAETVYISTPFSKLGLSAEGCSTYTFPRIMGPSKAAEMLYFGAPLSAKEAADVGLVSRVYERDAVDEIWGHLRKMSTLSPESLVATKQLISHWNKDILMEVNRKELEILKKIYTSPQFLERMAIFMMKKSKL